MEFKNNLDEKEIEELINLFNEYDLEKKGNINYSQIQDLLNKLGINFNHENILFNILSEHDINFNIISFHEFIIIYEKYKKYNNNEAGKDTLDVFIAMGGNPNGTGNIEADKLIYVIKKEFKMEINIEELIREIDDVN